VNFCKESNTEKDVIIKTLPITMTLNRLKELGKRLFGLGNKQLEFSYLTKEVNLSCSKIKTMYLLLFFIHYLLYLCPLLPVKYSALSPCLISPKSSVFHLYKLFLYNFLFLQSSLASLPSYINFHSHSYSHQAISPENLTEPFKPILPPPHLSIIGAVPRVM